MGGETRRPADRLRLDAERQLGRISDEAMSGALSLLESFSDEELSVFRHLCNKATLGASRPSWSVPSGD